MSAVGKSQVTAWKDLLETKGLSAAAPALEDYGMSCENDMLRLDEDDLVVLCCKLKPFPSKLLRTWVQGLVYEQRTASSMKDDSAAKQHCTSPPSEDGGDEDEDEQENGNEDEHADADEDSDEEDEEAHGGAAGEQGARDPKSIYVYMYLSICSWSLSCQRCLCWSLPFVCVTTVPMTNLFA
jgi:ABC-type Zn2+ transport system substrate-binding protein/surface adhesin